MSCKIKIKYIHCSIALFCCTVSNAWPDQHALALDQNRFEHIQFSRITPSDYSFRDNILAIEVDRSASFLMMPFDNVRMVRNVMFEWQATGNINVTDAEHESRRDGDDALFKLGLLLKGQARLHSPFAPAWLKRVRDLLKFPSENMVNLVVGAKHAVGSQWSSPYNERVTLVSVKSDAQADGWQRAQYSFELPQAVVAIWLMADGDNTGSKFTSRIRNLAID